MRILLAVVFLLSAGALTAQRLYEMPANAQSRLSSFENPNGVKGNGGKTNQTAKGNAFEWVMPGQTKTLLNTKGEGIIQRIWLTIDQTPVKLRSCRLQFFWEDASKPAVDVPLGDFFGYNLGKKTAFESALFSSGEGRSFNCYIPMPFKKAAKVLFINEGKDTVMLFYDIDYTLQKLPANTMYFHACWSRQRQSAPGDDFVVLPTVKGRGRFLGMTVGLNTDPSYKTSWWGEGEVKMYMDGDTKYPTINGTGSEDYIGSAWGLGAFTNLYQGCTVANDTTGQFNFYRFHIPDAVYFNTDIRVHFQQIGGWDREHLREIYKSGARLVPVTVAGNGVFYRLFEMKNAPRLPDENFPDGWVNFYRCDDYSAVAYFYLDKPVDDLPALAPVSERLHAVH